MLSILFYKLLEFCDKFIKKLIEKEYQKMITEIIKIKSIIISMSTTKNVRTFQSDFKSVRCLLATIIIASTCHKLLLVSCIVRFFYVI